MDGRLRMGSETELFVDRRSDWVGRASRWQDGRQRVRRWRLEAFIKARLLPIYSPLLDTSVLLSPACSYKARVRLTSTSSLLLPAHHVRTGCPVRCAGMFSVDVVPFFDTLHLTRDVPVPFPIAFSSNAMDVTLNPPPLSSAVLTRLLLRFALSTRTAMSSPPLASSALVLTAKCPSMSCGLSTSVPTMS